jgi:2-iminoacetate synthase ThiH
MTDEHLVREVLTQQQLDQEGQIVLSFSQLEEIVDRASQKGAKHVVSELGLHSEDAHKDIHDLRSLMSVIRGVQSTVVKTITMTLTTAIIGLIAAGIATKTKIFGGS